MKTRIGNGKQLVNLSFFICCLLFSVAQSSCGDDDGEMPLFTRDNLSVSDQTLVIEAKATNASLTVTANCQWTAELGADRWDGLTINKTPNRVDIVTTVNEKPQVRKATLTIRSQSGDVTSIVTIQQNAGNVNLSVSTAGIQLPAKTTDAGSSVAFTVTSNSSWSISGGADWLAYSPASGNGGAVETVTVTLTKDNGEEQTHSATLTVTADSVTRTVTVTQAPKVIELSVPQKTYEVAAIDGSCQVEVICNHTWTLQIDKTWLSTTPTSGNGNGVVTVVCQPNADSNTREATITFSSGSKQENIKIVQASSSAPVLGELVLSNVSKTQATVSCSYTSVFNVEEYGICYSTTNEEPTSDNNPIKYENGGMSGAIEELITGLSSGQIYYVRAFARNKSGIGYSKTKSFRTAGRKPGQDDNSEPSL